MTKFKAFVKVLSVTFVAAWAVVIASIGMPRAAGDPPIDTGGGSGGGGPPGGVADAPGGVSNDDGLWSTTVGGTEFSGLGASDVGKLLWRGQKVSTTILGDDGVPRTVQVCEDFPEITLESDGSKDCDANSPAGGAGVFWREDGCSGGYELSLGRARAWAQGRFHGEITGTVPKTGGRHVRFNRSTHHNMNLLLVGTANHEIMRCTINPTAIANLRVIAPVPLLGDLWITAGVEVSCDYDSDTGSD